LITINPADIKQLSGTGGCGKAVLNLSSAKTAGNNTGNVVIWGNGSTQTNQPGFAMNQGDVCQLQVIVRKAFSNLSNQSSVCNSTPPASLSPVTSSWSEQQTGPGTFSAKSPYTGSLLVDVSSDGQYH